METTTAGEFDFVLPLVSDLFIVEAAYRRHDRVLLSLQFRYDSERTMKQFRSRMKMSGYDFEVADREGGIILTVDPKRRLRIPLMNILLFGLTILTVIIVPVYFRVLDAMGFQGNAVPRTLEAVRNGVGWEFAAALISILLVHEMGHFIASRRRGIVTSWPYFIPAPNIVGTFGAVIKSRSPIWNRRDLIEVGASGPIAGWIVALGWLIYGLAHSSITPISPPPGGALLLSPAGESILMKFLLHATIGPLPSAQYMYNLSEAAFAGWAGLLVTAINMLPISQLDGGHVVYGLLRKQQPILGWISAAGLIVLGFRTPMWWLFAALGMLFGVVHPPTMNDQKPLSRVSITMGVAALVILVLSFTPAPF